jgi:hypothetical protein
MIMIINIVGGRLSRAEKNAEGGVPGATID